MKKLTEYENPISGAKGDVTDAGDVLRNVLGGAVLGVGVLLGGAIARPIVTAVTGLWHSNIGSGPLGGLFRPAPKPAAPAQGSIPAGGGFASYGL